LVMPGGIDGIPSNYYPLIWMDWIAWLSG
jgi:hypothetical protein